ncbi:MAG: asparaginase [Treponema sp.]|jgi:L-asparaginase II|nr:asparaginase [Treponema sp.]
MGAAVPLVHEYRGDTLDLIHCGHIAIVDEKSQVVYGSGDPESIVFYRSASKPIQALPAISCGLNREFSLTDEETVIFSGSHAGEPFHITALESIFSKSGLSEDMLIMKPAVPMNTEANEERIAKGIPRRKMYHNCSGKHAALMLLQRKLGGETEDYWKPGSPVQCEVMRTIKILGETDNIKAGVDGCGVPVFAIALRNIAASFKNLVRPEHIHDESLAQAVESYAPQIHRYPLMMAGTGRICTLLNQDQNIIAKGGANGVYGFALKKEGLGIAFKISDGTDQTWPLMVMGILNALGCLSHETNRRLEELHPGVILNDNGTTVGKREIVFEGITRR